LQTLILSKISNMNTMLFLNGQDWLIVLILVLLLFGGKKIPELMRGLGRGVREFNDAKNNVQSEIRKGMEEEPKNKEA
jgi:sec-independent protein translocase protein TatA